MLQTMQASYCDFTMNNHPSQLSLFLRSDKAL